MVLVRDRLHHGADVEGLLPPRVAPVREDVAYRGEAVLVAALVGEGADVAVRRVAPDVARMRRAVGRPTPKMYVSPISTRFARGRSTPSMRAMAYPCRCLWRGLSQIT